MKLFRKKPEPVMRRFEDRKPIDFNDTSKDVPAWVPPVTKVVLFILAIAFFPVTLVILWGRRYRNWFMGGHAGWEEDYEEADWAAVHRGEIPPPKLLQYDLDGPAISNAETPDR